MTGPIDTYADWQWNVNAWSKQDNPASAINHLLAYRRLGIKDTRSRAFQWLCYGQRHDADALAVYRGFRDSHGEQALFTAVLQAHGSLRPDAGETAVHLEWQAHNHPLSLVAALRAWGESSQGRIEAMFRLLEGQGHNARACQLYRAGFAHDLADVFSLVEAQVDRFATVGHDHPYLNGSRPAAQVFRDEVPALARSFDA